MSKPIRVGELTSLSGFSKMIGKTIPTVKHLLDEGLPHIVEGSRILIDTAAGTKWLIEHEVNKVLPIDAETGEQRLGINEIKRRYELAKMAQAELALGKEREQLVNIEDVMENFIHALVQVRSRLVSQSARLSGILTFQDQTKVGEILDEDATDTLEILSEYAHEYIEHEQSSKEEPRVKDNQRIHSMPVPTPKIKPR